jgi:hypothetical protein
MVCIRRDCGAVPLLPGYTPDTRRIHAVDNNVIYGVYPASIGRDSGGNTVPCRGSLECARAAGHAGWESGSHEDNDEFQREHSGPGLGRVAEIPELWSSP